MVALLDLRQQLQLVLWDLEDGERPALHLNRLIEEHGSFLRVRLLELIGHGPC